MAAYEVNGMKSKEKRNKHKITVSPKFIKSVKWIAVIFALFLLIYTVLYVIGRYRFEVSFYQLSSEKVADKIRVIELADLHNWTFGKDNKDLVKRIKDLKPDVIAIAGDMVLAGNQDISVAVSLCRQLVEIAPVYYSFGNHENEMVYGTDMLVDFLDEQAAISGTEEDGTLDYDKISMVDARLPEALKDAGVVILNSNTAGLKIRDQQVDIAGVDNLSGGYFPYSAHMIENFLTTNSDNLKIIIAHRPLIPYAGICYQEELRYDLLLCGHKHGGIIRVPGLGGMFTSGGGYWNWFTGYDSGLIPNAQGNVVISRGLGNSNLLPRVNNTPELVVIDID